MLHFLPVKQVLRTFLFLCFSSLFFSNCKKNSDTIATDGRPDLTTKVTASLVSGFVTDENDHPVENAAVVIGDIISATDKYGYFESGNVKVVQTAATVTVNKTGYFKAIKTFIAAEGKGAFFRIKLLPKNNIGLFNAVSGGTVTLPGGFFVRFPANAITDISTNKPFTGDVNVFVTLLDATDPDLGRIMPGDLRGVNTENRMRLLTTYGMVGVELLGAGGEFLQLTTGKKAVLNMPIPTSLQVNAPASIPLWYFDEKAGLWREEGSAAKSGSAYVGEVSHFTFWNCDVPNNYVRFDCKLVNSQGQPIRFALVKATALNSNLYFSDYGYTDTSGFVSGFVPNNAQIKLEVFDNSNCSGAIYSQVFTTTSVNISLGTIIIPTGTRVAILEGSVKKCNNAPVTSGSVLLSDGNTTTRYPLSSTGTFSITKSFCNFPATVTLVAEDASSGQQSAPVIYTVNASGLNTVPSISACGVNTQEFFSYTENGITRTYNVPTDTMYMFANNGPVYTNMIYARSLPLVPTDYVTITFDIWNAAAGSNMAISTFAFPQNSSYIFNSGVVHLTEYGPVGGFEAGTFTATKTDLATQTQHSYTGSFRIRRTN
ncbi:MAG: hypothetical protein U0V75_15785 [Ferruginibacter sp.]